MCDEAMLKELSEAVATVAAADLACASPDELRTVLRVVQTSIDALTATHARASGAFDAMGAHEEDACASVGTWLRRELRLTPAEIRCRRLAEQALTFLDDVRAAADSGEIRPEHVTAFGEGIGYLGEQIMREAQPMLLPVARECDPRELRAAIQRLREAVDPDAADRDWAKAQEKQDLTCTPAGNGFLVRGFLDPETGSQLSSILASWGKPVTVDGEAPDDRPIARRRVDGLSGLLGAYLGSGSPSDKGVRPHLNVTVDHQTLLLALRGDRITPTPTPPTLAGFGVIGRDLLARLACDASLTLLLTDSSTQRHRCTADHPRRTDGEARSGVVGSAGVLHRCGCPLTPYVHVLDVGDTERTATSKQRLAVLTAQHYRCAAPGCNNRHLEVHHIVSWLDSGRTDMDNLVGLCSSCHTLLHRGLIVCRSDGHGGALFERRDGTPITDVRRRSLAAFAERLRDHVSGIVLRQHQRLRSREHPPARPRDGDGDGRPDRTTTPPF